MLLELVHQLLVHIVFFPDKIFQTCLAVLLYELWSRPRFVIFYVLRLFHAILFIFVLFSKPPSIESFLLFQLGRTFDFSARKFKEKPVGKYRS